MANDAQKVPFTQSMNEFAQAKIAAALFLTGKSLPASVVAIDGQIVTVNFEVSTAFTLPNDIKVPVATSLYRREPIQVGDLGVVRSSDVTLGGINGLGAGTAKFPSTTASLEALVWEPIANANWAASPDPNAYLIQGPNGVIIRDVDNDCSIVLDTTKIVVTGKTDLKLVVGGSSIEITPSGIAIVGTLTINGQPYLAHTHQVVSVGSPTGPVLP